jgi:hypothetical protein
MLDDSPVSLEETTQQHIEQSMTAVEQKKAEGTLYKPSESFWEISKPTFIENWPVDLFNLSIPTAILMLDDREARTLGSYITELGEAFDNVPEEHETIKKFLVDKLDIFVKRYPHGAFVRLGSRSPKDALYWGCRPTDSPDGRVRSGEEAFWRLTACSERIYDDLQMQLAMHYDPRIVVRQWIDLPEWTEFRCFQRDGQLIGISQYYHRGVYSELETDAAALKWAIQQFHEKLFKPVTALTHLRDVIFDVFVKKAGGGEPSGVCHCGATMDGHSVYDNHAPVDNPLPVRWEVKLLEINPFFNMTDPCLFDWNRPEDFAGQLRYRKELGPRATSTCDV